MGRISKGQLARMEKEKNRNAIAAMRILKNNTFKNLNPMQQMMIIQLIETETREAVRHATIQGYEQGMIAVTAALCQVITEDYWKKTSNKRLPRLVHDIADLMNSALRQVVTWEEQAKYIEERSGVALKLDWVGKEDYPTPKSLFEGIANG